MYSVFSSLEFAAVIPPSALPGISPLEGKVKRLWNTIIATIPFSPGGRRCRQADEGEVEGEK